MRIAKSPTPCKPSNGRTILRCSVGSALLVAATLAQASTASSSSSCPPAAGVNPTIDCTIAELVGHVSAQATDEDALYAAVRGLEHRAELRSQPGDVDAMLAIVRELDARHATRPWDRRQLLQVLLLAGRIEQARIVQAQIPSAHEDVYPSRIRLATARSSGEARYFALDSTSGLLHEHAIDVGHGPHILVQATEGCHFCRDALRRIPRDPTLAAAFRDHAMWYSRPDAASPLQVLARWDEQHPEVPLAVVEDLGGWPSAGDSWRTPVFHFVLDGRVMKSVIGWNPGKTEAELRDGLKAIGLPVVDR